MSSFSKARARRYTAIEKMQVAHMCANFVIHLFQCPDVGFSGAPDTRLHSDIAHILDVTPKLAPYSTFHTLYVLQRLRTRLGDDKGDLDGPTVFLTAYVLAMKTSHNETDNAVFNSDILRHLSARRSLSAVRSLSDLNNSERWMCRILDFDCNVQPEALAAFEDKVRRDFAGTGPYPEYILPQTSLGPEGTNAVVESVLNPTRIAAQLSPQSTISRRSSLRKPAPKLQELFEPPKETGDKVPAAPPTPPLSPSSSLADSLARLDWSILGCSQPSPKEAIDQWHWLDTPPPAFQTL